MLIEYRTEQSLSEVDEALAQAAARHKFGIIAKHDLALKMKEKGVSFGRECLIYEVCNPNQAKKALEANMSVSTMLPCRISVWRDGKACVLQTARPTELLQGFNAPELAGVAREVEETLDAMMREAARQGQ